MKKMLSIALIAATSVVLVISVIFSDFEIGKYDDFQEAIEKGIPYRVNDIIHTEQYDNVTIVLYTTDPNKEDFPFAEWEALAVAFFTGNEEEGWENIGNHGWKHYENDNMTIYVEPLRDYDRQGNRIHEFYVVYGEINNPEIAIIETKSKEEESFEETDIIVHQGKRYYLKFGRETVVRGLSKSGDVIDRQGG
jgi:hypothetical protein